MAKSVGDILRKLVSDRAKTLDKTYDKKYPNANNQSKQDRTQRNIDILKSISNARRAGKELTPKDLAYMVWDASAKKGTGWHGADGRPMTADKIENLIASDMAKAGLRSPDSASGGTGG